MHDNATADSLFIKHYFYIKHQGSVIVHVLSSHLNSFFQLLERYLLYKTKCSFDIIEKGRIFKFMKHHGDEKGIELKVFFSVCSMVNKTAITDIFGY